MKRNVNLKSKNNYKKALIKKIIRVKKLLTQKKITSKFYNNLNRKIYIKIVF